MRVVPQRHWPAVVAGLALAVLVILAPAGTAAVDLRATFAASLASGEDPVLQRVFDRTQGHSPTLRELGASNSRLHGMEAGGPASAPPHPQGLGTDSPWGSVPNRLQTFLERNTGVRDNLSRVFRRMDRDGDGRVSERELAAMAGISEIQLDAVMSLDAEGSGYVSHDQFLQIPVLVSLLEANPAIMNFLQDDSMDPRTRRALVQHTLAGVFGRRPLQRPPQEQQHLDSLAEVQAEFLPGLGSGGGGGGLAGALKGGLNAAANAALGAALNSAGLSPASGMQPAAPLAPLPAGPNGIPNSPWQAVNLTMTAGSRPLSGRLRDDLFKEARFGVPSEANEHCVMCQYAVQMIRRMLYEHVRSVAPHIVAAPANRRGLPPQHPGIGDDSAADTGTMSAPASSPNASAPRSNWPNLPASVDEMQPPPIDDIDRAVSAAMRQPGARGLVRILTEDVFNELCSVNNIPELFYPSCRVLWSVSRQIDYNIFFRFPSSLTCAEAGLCGAGTYFQSNFAVHMPDQSRSVNGQRGLCGLAGGNHDLQSSMCQRGANLLSLQETTEVPRSSAQIRAEAAAPFRV